MARKSLGLLLIALIGLTSACSRLHAGGTPLERELLELDRHTGLAPRQMALKHLLDDKEHAKKVIAAGLPAAKKKDMSYDAAMVLALAAADLKDMKASETYFRVCINHAVMLQSVAKLGDSYDYLIKIYYSYKQYGDAARICKEVLELNTDDSKEREVLRVLSDRTGETVVPDPGRGLGDPAFATAQRLRPFFMESYVKALAKQGKTDQALKMVEGLSKRSDDWNNQRLKGWVLQEAGKLADAVENYESVIKAVANDRRLDPEDQDELIEQYRYEVSNVYIEMKKIDKATEHLEFLRKRYPDKSVYHNDLGYILADNDMRLEEAEKMIRKALELDRARRKKSKSFDPKTDQDPGAYLDSLGWVLFKQKKNEEAKDWLIKALDDKSAQHIEIYDHLADVHMALGERDLAIKAWTEGLNHVNDSRRDKERKAEVEKKLAKAKDSK